MAEASREREQCRSLKLPENFDRLLEEAIQLKREVPKCSVNQIIYILELEGQAAPGALKRSTLERYLYKAGFDGKRVNVNLPLPNKTMPLYSAV